MPVATILLNENDMAVTELLGTRRAVHAIKKGYANNRNFTTLNDRDKDIVGIRGEYALHKFMNVFFDVPVEPDHISGHKGDLAWGRLWIDTKCLTKEHAVYELQVHQKPVEFYTCDIYALLRLYGDGPEQIKTWNRVDLLGFMKKSELIVPARLKTESRYGNPLPHPAYVAEESELARSVLDLVWRDE